LFTDAPTVERSRANTSMIIHNSSNSPHFCHSREPTTVTSPSKYPPPHYSSFTSR
jgi:hypothetical protein